MQPSWEEEERMIQRDRSIIAAEQRRRSRLSLTVDEWQRKSRLKAVIKDIELCTFTLAKAIDDLNRAIKPDGARVSKATDTSFQLEIGVHSCLAAFEGESIDDFAERMQETTGQSPDPWMLGFVDKFRSAAAPVIAQKAELVREHAEIQSERKKLYGEDASADLPNRFAYEIEEVEKYDLVRDAENPVLLHRKTPKKHHHG